MENTEVKIEKENIMEIKEEKEQLENEIVEKTEIKRNSYTKQLNTFGTRVLIWSLIWFAIGLVCVVSVSFLGNHLISQYYFGSFEKLYNIMIGVLVISLLIVFGFSIGSGWRKYDSALWVNILFYIFYILFYSMIMLSILVLLQKTKIDSNIILYSLVATGILTLICASIGWGMSKKFMMQLWKIIVVCVILVACGTIIFSVIMYYVNQKVYDVWFLVSSIVIGIVFCVFMIVCFCSISNVCSNVDITSVAYNKKMLWKKVMGASILYGTEILNSFMELFRIITYLIVSNIRT